MGMLLIPMAFLVMVHVALTKSDFKAGIARCLRLCWPRHVKTRKEIDQALRFEQEFLKVKLHVFGYLHCLAIQIIFLVILVITWKLMEDQSGDHFTRVLWVLSGYVQHALIQSGVVQIKTQAHFLQLEALAAVTYTSFLYSMACETKVEAFYFMETIANVTVILSSVVFIDLKLSIPIYLSGALVMTYKHWEFTGFETVTPVDIFSTLVSHTCAMSGLFFLVFAIHNHIWAKLDSDDTSSLLAAFRKVLRGVCDGDLVLDRHTCNIVDDAASLEQLLKTDKHLAETNFLDLLLDDEGREKFRQFLGSAAAAKENTASIPPCLRLSLQGAEGPVSMDVFCTSCGAAGRDYYLMALKADPDQFLPPPDAGPQHTVPRPEQLGPSLGRGSEVVEAFKELVQVSLLVNNDTPCFDVEEANLSFMRSPDQDGMPTLRSFVRLSDWQRVEALFQTASTNYDAEEEDAKAHRLAAPLLFRIPQSRSRSYLCVEQVDVSVAEDVDGVPASFWVNLSAFHARHVRRQRDPDLESISEE